MAKEEAVLKLFLENPTKHWHFEEILKTAKISRPQADGWLKKFVKEKLVTRIKPKGKMPFYTADYESPDYQLKKRLFALMQLEKAGLLKCLLTLPKAETIIIFGSMSRWDWYKESDLDIFVYGNIEDVKLGSYREKLHREIQMFICRNKEEVKNMNPALLKNIVEGYMVKGSLDFVEVKASA